jgi:hypothetical protein
MTHTILVALIPEQSGEPLLESALSLARHTHIGLLICVNEVRCRSTDLKNELD